HLGPGQGPLEHRHQFQVREKGHIAGLGEAAAVGRKNLWKRRFKALSSSSLIRMKNFFLSAGGGSAFGGKAFPRGRRIFLRKTEIRGGRRQNAELSSPGGKAKNLRRIFFHG